MVNLESPETRRELAFYLRQSPFTSPGAGVRSYRDLPFDVPGLVRIVQGLIVHYRSQEVKRASIPRNRLLEINTRYVDRMIARLKELNDRPLTCARDARDRLVGCCRDFAVLFTSMARYRGIPARVRVGFANYFADYPSRFWIDHTIAEYWSARERRWRLVDPEQTPALLGANNIKFDPTDVPRTRFLVGGDAWQMCRKGTVDPDAFGVLARGQPRGLWFVRSRLLLDLAALNRNEVLLWDAWSAAGPGARIGAVGLKELDQRASLSSRDPPPLKGALSLYRSRRWKVPRVVWVYSPVRAPYRETLRVAA